jgi:hypothetical protein
MCYPPQGQGLASFIPLPVTEICWAEARLLAYPILKRRPRSAGGLKTSGLGVEKQAARIEKEEVELEMGLLSLSFSQRQTPLA